MKFSKLKLNGFKSFVDPTELIIHDGLTGVVGPNGCGKSNLLEALRWVMGENRPKAMRGGGMEDVIFAGAMTRPARNFAEVSLHIDNGQRLAPAGFNDEDTLEVVRRITRDIGSAYKANTKEVRARDVQMLFADASTGAHSPALVRQGQISELINAKPKARRRILEEAAGISGLYARRHEAELKLKGAETNLARVDDVIEQLANQLAQLARQARQATRYREIGAELRLAEGLLLYRRWKEADEALAAASEALKNSTVSASKAESEVRAAQAAREKAEDALPPLREDEAISQAVLQRLQVQRDTLSDQENRAAEMISGLENRIGQLTNDMTREAALNKDAEETIERLKIELEALVASGEGHEERLESAGNEAQEAGVVLSAREAALSEKTEDVARLAAKHQSTQRFLDDSKQRVGKSESEEQAAIAAITTAQDAVAKAETDFNAAQAQEKLAAETVEDAETTLAKAETARSTCQADENNARSKRSETAGVVSALRAEVSALEKLVARDSGGRAAVLDEVIVDQGFEKALGAALADDLRAPVSSGSDGSGWVLTSPYSDAPELPAGTGRFVDRVRVPGVLARRMAFVGIVDAADGDRLQPQLQAGQRLVSVEGDLWRWDGFKTTAKDAPSAAALRLEQQNRLRVLNTELAAAQDAADAAEAEHERLAGRLRDLAQADQMARQARRDADRLMADAGRALSRAEAEKNLSSGKVETLQMAATRHAEEATEARAQLTQAQNAQRDLPDLDVARAEVEDIKLTVEAARVTMMSRRSAHDEVRREGENRSKRISVVGNEIKSWTKRLENATDRAKEMSSRLDQAETELTEAKAAPGELAAKRSELTAALQDAENRRAKATDALAEAEGVLRTANTVEREAEARASDAREDRARLDARKEAAQETLNVAAERVQEEMETTPQALLEQLDVDPEKMPSSDKVEADVARLRRQRDALGAVNLRAEEDAKEVQEEHDNLKQEKEDLEEAISTLRSAIGSLNKEGRERLLAAFDEVNKNFGTLFSHLFGGGEANLVMVESDDPLEAGLEIMCQPPGKKLSTLSLLSGGEQTLTALALIFAVFLANPAPICVLDEVDAPLDDANVGRFCDLLDEMTRRTDTRFLIITHHAVTMSRMNRLFGVTMAEQGVSQLVSVDLQKAEELVA